MKKIRLDKYIADRLNLSRKQARIIIYKGNVIVNDMVQKNIDYTVDQNDIVYHGESRLPYGPSFYYYLLNKPTNYITASIDNKHKTVMELMPSICLKNSIMPVGRLDIDTTGLLLFTNDGQLAHRLINPKYHVEKVYIAKIDRLINDNDIEQFKKGIEFKDFISKSALLQKTDISPYHVKVIVVEGKFHQVKRMFMAINANVEQLSRISFGTLNLDVEMGEYRYLNNIEVAQLYKACGLEL